MTDDAPPERPLLAPWIGWLADGRPALFYADGRGQIVRLPLDGIALARLGLSLAEAQALLGRRQVAEAAVKNI
ncbi:hypothetical protein [Methylobacterium sp. CCH5-D2]|uniref:hypothetical protein n=1 Tax=Methylobacterium sp. CCH5-D2 TaxID=1768765 RepID=UPI00082D0D08|nr:hypothetical protein [Methylobacterium sp. CCH5-D2]